MPSRNVLLIMSTLLRCSDLRFINFSLYLASPSLSIYPPPLLGTRLKSQEVVKPPPAKKPRAASIAEARVQHALREAVPPKLPSRSMPAPSQPATPVASSGCRFWEFLGMSRGCYLSMLRYFKTGGAGYDWAPCMGSSTQGMGMIGSPAGVSRLAT